MTDSLPGTADSNVWAATPVVAALLEATSAITPPCFDSQPWLNPRRRFDQKERFILGNRDVESFREKLQRQFNVGSYDLENLYASLNEAHPDHTWLGRHSRFAAFEAPIFNDLRSYDFPILLPNPSSAEQMTPSTTYLARQRATGRTRALDVLDCNDFLVSAPGDEADAELEALRRFMALLYAQRRTRIFASSLSERIYNIWLPPGMFEPRDAPDEAFVLLPYVTRVRRPYRQDFRDTVTLSLIFVPIAGHTYPTGPREMRPREVLDLLYGIDSSTHISAEAAKRYQLLDSPLRRYVEELAGIKERRSAQLAGYAVRGTDHQDPMTGTLRQWFELFFLAIEEPVFPSEYANRLPDAILTSLRCSTIWSTLLVGPPLNEPGTNNDVVDFGLPGSVRDFLDRLRDMQGPNPGPMEPFKPPSQNDDSYVLWYTFENTIVVVEGSGRQHWPEESFLYGFGFIGHMNTGLASAKSIMTTLAVEAEYSYENEAPALARKAFLLSLELEEMFDLDIASPGFEQRFRQARQALGIERQYRNVKRLMGELSQHADVVSRSQQDERIAALQLGGAVLAMAVLAIQAFTVVSSRMHGLYGLYSLLIFVAATLPILYLVCRRFLRRASHGWFRRRGR